MSSQGEDLMRTGGASQFGLTQQTLPTLRAMDEDEMDAGIDVSEAGSNQPSPPLVIAPTRPHKQLARSHAVLTRTASKPEHGSKQGVVRNDAKKQLRAFLQKRNSDMDMSVHANFVHHVKVEASRQDELQKRHWGQSPMDLITQHPPDSLAILNTPYQQSEESDPNIAKVKTKLRGKMLKDRNSPIHRGSLKRKSSSNVEGNAAHGNGPSSGEGSPCASPKASNVLNSESSLSEEMETVESAGDSAVSSFSQLSGLAETASATSSLQSLPPGSHTFGPHPPVIHAVSWPRQSGGEEENQQDAFTSRLAQQVATMNQSTHRALHRTIAQPVPVVGIPPQHVKPLTIVSPPKQESHTPTFVPPDPGQLFHRKLGQTRSAPLPGQLPVSDINSHELQFNMQSLRAQYELEQRELLRQYQMKQRQLAAIQMEGEEQLRMHLMQLQTAFRQRELMLAQEHELKQSQMQMRQAAIGKDASYTASEQGVRGESSLPSGTGLAYDGAMLKHDCTCNGVGTHHEHPGRLQSIYARLQETGVLDRCIKLKSRKASIEELQLVHSEDHVTLYSSPMMQKPPLEQKLSGGSRMTPNPVKSLRLLPCGGYGVDDDTVWNDAFTSPAARIAAGCTIDLTLKVASGELRNGFAVVRPPGHHAEPQQAMGFCYFNNVAIAAKTTLTSTNVSKIAIVDWDVHHGNGTQRAFLDNPDILYISIHRHDNGTFFPGTGAIDECGVGRGVGMTVNIPFTGGINHPCGDPEYLAAFRVIVMPILREFKPEIVIVSAGFDACMGHTPNLGGYMVTPECFGYMTAQLMEVCNGRVVMALEGGYELRAICCCSEACVKTLLGEEIPPIPLDHQRAKPHEKAVEVLNQCRIIQSNFWESLCQPCNVDLSALEVDQREKEADTVQALQALSMGNSHRGDSQPVQSRH
ncbi:histone deacetylase 4-like isoform X3 [Corticium candelabrum]|uniref:histone deacetylase 4-like isoform X3 n=1 Tax=Corticium candelabrum TaxID=121492 RepID=UPI002E25D3EF|nr:histone deacetylase 4-like isoform X3 [Corticium candelabrum]